MVNIENREIDPRSPFERAVEAAYIIHEEAPNTVEHSIAGFPSATHAEYGISFEAVTQTGVPDSFTHAFQGYIDESLDYGPDELLGAPFVQLTLEGDRIMRTPMEYKIHPETQGDMAGILGTAEPISHIGSEELEFHHATRALSDKEVITALTFLKVQFGDAWPVDVELPHPDTVVEDPDRAGVLSDSTKDLFKRAAEGVVEKSNYTTTIKSSNLEQQRTNAQTGRIEFSDRQQVTTVFESRTPMSVSYVDTNEEREGKLVLDREHVWEFDILEPVRHSSRPKPAVLTYVAGGIEVGRMVSDYGKAGSQSRADEAELVIGTQVKAGLAGIEGTARKLLYRRFSRAANAVKSKI